MKEILLTRGYVSLVDDEDYDALCGFRWSVSLRKGGILPYAQRVERIEGKTRGVYMHRQIMNAPKGKDIDHINHNTLDNRRVNLRICSRSENTSNSIQRAKGYRGVYKNGSGWMARLQVRGRDIYIGTFRDAKDAASAYDDVARSHHGKFAITNFQLHPIPQKEKTMTDDPAGSVTNLTTWIVLAIAAILSALIIYGAIEIL